jgi:signal transduction histidine kinase
MYQKSLEEYERALTLNHPQAEKVKEKIQQLKKLLHQNPTESKRSSKALRP